MITLSDSRQSSPQESLSSRTTPDIWKDAQEIATAIEQDIQTGIRLSDAFQKHSSLLMEVSKDRDVAKRLINTWVFGLEFSNWLSHQKSKVGVWG